MVLRRGAGLWLVGWVGCGPAEVGWSVLPADPEVMEDADGCTFSTTSATWTLVPMARPTRRDGSVGVWPSWTLVAPNASLDYGPSVEVVGARYAEVRLGVAALTLEGQLGCDGSEPVDVAYRGVASVDVVCAGPSLAAAEGSTTWFAVALELGWPWGEAIAARAVWSAATASSTQGEEVDLIGLDDPSLPIAAALSSSVPAALGVQGAVCSVTSVGLSD